MSKIFLHTPIMGISSKDPGQWAMYELGNIKADWLDIIGQNLKFIETYFPDRSKDICAEPYMMLKTADEVYSVLQDEARHAFGTVWNRSFFIMTEDTPKSPIWIPNKPGSMVLRGDIRSLATMIFCQRIFIVFQEKFPKLLQFPAQPPASDMRKHFKDKKEEKDDTVKINYMQMSRAYPTPFTDAMHSEMQWAINHVGQGFASQRNGGDISIKAKIDDVGLKGYRIIVPQTDIKSESTMPALIPIAIKDMDPMIKYQVRFIVNIYRDDKLWRTKHGNMIQFGFMEMWYKLFEQMLEDKGTNYTIVLVYATASELEASSVSVNTKPI